MATDAWTVPRALAMASALVGERRAAPIPAPPPQRVPGCKSARLARSSISSIIVLR